MAEDMVIARDMEEDTEEVTAGVTVVDMITAEDMAGDLADTCTGTVPDTGEAMGMAGEAMEEAMPGIIEDIMAGDTDTAEAQEWDEDIVVPITGDHVTTVTATGIEHD